MVQKATTEVTNAKETNAKATNAKATNAKATAARAMATEPASLTAGADLVEEDTVMIMTMGSITTEEMDTLQEEVAMATEAAVTVQEAEAAIKSRGRM
jgi:hypothetical protein